MPLQPHQQIYTDYFHRYFWMSARSMNHKFNKPRTEFAHTVQDIPEVHNSASDIYIAYRFATLKYMLILN